MSAMLCSSAPVFAQAPNGTTSTKPQSKPAGSHRKSSVTTKKKPVRASQRSSRRFRRMHRAFVASTTLKPMAQQLLENRTPAAYAGVEAFARRHSAEDAGALAWLAVGYAHFLDHDYAKAIDPLNRAKPHAGDIGDYVVFYLANSYLQSGHIAEAIAGLSTFEKNYSGSLLIRDARLLYANALVTDNRPKEAVAVLEDIREPIRSDLELALGRAYEAEGDPAKAVGVLRHLYFTLPLSYEAGVAETELGKLASTPGIAPPSFGDRKSRADLLTKAKRYTEAADAYR